MFKYLFILISIFAFRTFAGLSYAINSDNDALISFNSSNGSSETIESLNFYSQGQVAYDVNNNKSFIFDSNNDRVVVYDFTANSSSYINIDNNADQVLSIFGFDDNGNLIAITDDFNESKTIAKRFATISTDGTLTRIGSPLVESSAYPQGNQLYDSVNNKIYTISNDSSAVFSILDLNTNEATSFSTSASTLAGFSPVNNSAYSIITGTDNPSILVTNLSTGDESVLTTTLPDGYDNFASSAYVDISNDEISIFVGGRGVTGVATYSTVDGSFQRVISTTGTGRFVNTVLLKNVEEGSETLSEDIASELSEIIKLGEGQLNITGDSESSGATSILEGTLKINGEHDESTATISSGATLGGSGTVGGIVSNGNLEPGNSIGTLNVSGDVTLNSGSVLVIEVDTAGNNDKIVATGDVTAGGTLRISPASGTYTNGQQYTIITGSSIAGTFSTVTVLSCSGTASPSYGSTSITFTLSNCSFSAPKNRESISSYINDLSSGASGDLSTVITAINTLSGDNYNKALEAIDYNTSGASSLLTNQQFSHINSMINQRIGITNNSSSKLLNRINLQSNLSNKDSLKHLSFKDKLQAIGATGWWVRAFGGKGEKESLTGLGVNGYDYDFIGTTVGFDDDINHSKNGWALTTSKGSIDSFSSEGKTEQKTFALSRYFSNKLPNDINQTYSASLSINDIESKRYLNFASIDRTASADYKSYGLDFNYQLSYPPAKAFNLEHHIDFDTGFSYIHQDGFTETGANSLNLNVESHDSKILRLGVKDTILFNQVNTITPYLMMGISGTHIFDDATIKQKLVNQTSTLTTDSDRKTDLYADIGFGFVDSIDDNAELSFGVNSKFSDKISEYSVDANYHYKF